MKRFDLKFTGQVLNSLSSNLDTFDVCVPGNIQKDYASHMGWGDINYGDNCLKYKDIEDYSWQYITKIDFKISKNEEIYFISEGIDYAFDIFINDKKVFYQEGLFTPVKLKLTDIAVCGDELKIIIHPTPKLENVQKDTRCEAAHICKPAVSYGWDWHPRVIPSGVWQDTYLLACNADDMIDLDIHYTLDDALENAEIFIKCEKKVEFSLYDTKNNLVLKTNENKAVLINPILWWCRGQGEQYLYSYTAKIGASTRNGKIGFRKIALTKNDGSEIFNSSQPKTRNVPPITLTLNGRKIFAKGSNWVNPEIFTGCIDKQTYEPLVKLAADANMNIFRCWGGAIVNKDSFYELCDQYGIMVWQEFPLACNDYPDDPKYLEVLSQEACSIIKRLKVHPCIVIWCGGNELFNSWSGMDDQSYPLRLLNKLCYELDTNTPFLPTSPLMGMAHGYYKFKYEGKDAFQLLQSSAMTAYTEFGIPSLADADYLKQFIPKEELFPPKPMGSYVLHHAFKAWSDDAWLCDGILNSYFNPPQTLEELCENSSWLQCEGLKAIFEEARRQRPLCSMAINWCYNEPWKTAANNSIISYPSRPKKAYYSVKDALRDTMLSGKIPKFSWESGEEFYAEIWLLNDSITEHNVSFKAIIEVDGVKFTLLENTIFSGKNQNKKSHTILFTLPKSKQNYFYFHLNGGEYSSSYKLHIKTNDIAQTEQQMNT